MAKEEEDDETYQIVADRKGLQEGGLLKVELRGKPIVYPWLMAKFMLFMRMFT